ncbi:amidohydrolase family protein [Pectobacterium cacticida]|uniref:amidohydrolase family protein n=1 Tax=Pectobacterium cacticida TaxID=69221 RepID=UPI002FEF102C
MTTVSRRTFLYYSLALLTMPLTRSVAQTVATPTVLDRVRLVDGLGGAPVENARIVIADGRIAAIGSSQQVAIPLTARVIPVNGGTVIPGLISNHVHLGGYDGLVAGPSAQNADNILKQLNVYLSYGVTTVASMGTNGALVYDLRSRLSAGSVSGADILVADHGIGVPNGAPPAPLGPDQLDRPASVQEARQAVRAAAARGTNFIKLWLDDFQGLKLVKMSPEIYRAAIDEAHKNNLRAFVHIHYLDDAKDVLRAGADVLAHGVRDKAIDGEFIELMRKNNAWYIPTLTVDEAFYLFAEQPQVLQDPFVRKALHPDLLKQYESEEWRTKQLSNPKALASWHSGLAVNQQNTKTAIENGLNVGFGTDSGAMPLRVPGFAEHRELELLVESGISPLQALTLATGKAAQALKLEDRGVLAVGKRADLVVIDGNPIKNISDTRRIRSVWKAGAEVSVLSLT